MPRPIPSDESRHLDLLRFLEPNYTASIASYFFCGILMVGAIIMLTVFFFRQLEPIFLILAILMIIIGTGLFGLGMATEAP